MASTSAAHRGALNAHGQTVAIWGTGVDVTYPKENQKLADQILATGGAILSEFPLGTFPAPQNFPIRNRIISGMSIGVLVIEAGEYSGTRVTARCALEQGRDVYAVPGNVTNKLSWGPNTLIKQGAALVATWEDVWEALPADTRLALTPPEPPASQAPETASLFAGPGIAAGRKTDLCSSARRRADPHRRTGGAAGRPDVFVADFRRVVRTGVERQDPDPAGKVLRQGDLRLPASAFRLSEIRRVWTSRAHVESRIVRVSDASVSVSRFCRRRTSVLVS